MRYARPALHQEKQNIRIGNSRKQNCAESRNFFSSQFRPNSSRWSNVIAVELSSSKHNYHIDQVVGIVWFPYVPARFSRVSNSRFPCELHNSDSPNLTNIGTPMSAKESLFKADNAILPLDNIAFWIIMKTAIWHSLRFLRFCRFSINIVHFNKQRLFKNVKYIK